jgi:hypothetical protein
MAEPIAHYVLSDQRSQMIRRGISEEVLRQVLAAPSRGCRCGLAGRCCNRRFPSRVAFILSACSWIQTEIRLWSLPSTERVK